MTKIEAKGNLCSGIHVDQAQLFYCIKLVEIIARDLSTIHYNTNINEYY